MAVEMVRKGLERNDFSYGLIFMDCSMPIMNGYEAADLIREFARKNHL